MALLKCLLKNAFIYSHYLHNKSYNFRHILLCYIVAKIMADYSLHKCVCMYVRAHVCIHIHIYNNINYGSLSNTHIYMANRQYVLHNVQQMVQHTHLMTQVQRQSLTK